MRQIICVAMLALTSCAGNEIQRVPIVRLGQMSLNYCTSEVIQGKPAALVMLFVIQPSGADKTVTVTLTNGKKVNLIGNSLEIPSGIGRHEVLVDVGGKQFKRIFFVYECD